MDATDKARFTGIYYARAESLGRELTGRAMQLLWDALRDLPMEDFERGFMVCVNDPLKAGYLPQPGDVRRALGELSPTEKAERAWTECLGAVRDHSPYESVVFGDRCLAAALRHMGGWIAAAQWGDDELVWRKKEFVGLYVGFVASGVPESTPSRFEGLCERQNRVGGYLGSPAWKQLEGSMAPTALVGDGARLLLEEPEDKSGEVLAELKRLAGSMEPPKREFKPSDLVESLKNPSKAAPLEAVSEEEWERRRMEQKSKLEALRDGQA